MRILIALAVLTLSVKSYGQQIPGVVATQIATGITKVTDIENCGDDRLFFVQQTGLIKIYQNGTVLPQPFLNISTLVSSGGEQGLLGMAFSPDYNTSGFFYIDYTNTAGNTVIARYRVSPTNPDSAMTSGSQILLTINQPYSNHNGGCIKFDKEGFLMIGMGDGGSGGDPMGNGQNKKALLGKMLRIDVSDTLVTYKIPATNPFVNDTSFAPEIWNYGMRNPWRYSFDRITHDLWIADVGQNLYEEINKETYGSGGGFNYGWRCVEGLHTYNSTGNCLAFVPDMIPVFEYPHSGKCSVSGGYVYRGANSDRLFGKYFYADYCESKIRCLTQNASGLWVDSILVNSPSGVSTFGEDQYGELYFGNNSSGTVYKLSDTLSCTPVAFAAFDDTLKLCGQTSYTFNTPYQPSFLYQWYLDGNVIQNSDTNTITVSQNGTYYVQVAGINFCSNTSDSVYVMFLQNPVASISALDTIYCSNDAGVPLVGIPTGGTFSINGNAAVNFDPVALGVGNYKVQYLYTDSNGCTASAEQFVAVDACLGIQNLEKGEIKIVPNPGNGVFTIFLDESFHPIINVEVSDLTGKSVYALNNIKSNGNQIKIDLSHLPQSAYLLKVNDSNKSVTKKLFIRN